MARGRAKKTDAQAQAKNGNGANLGFEAELFFAADKLRNNLEPFDYKYVVLGLIFLRHISMHSKRSAKSCSPKMPARRKTRTNISPRTCFECRKRRAGRIFRRTPSN